MFGNNTRIEDYILGLNHNQIINFVYDAYNSGHYYEYIDYAREVLISKLSNHTKLQREFLMICFDIATNKITKEIDLKKFEIFLDQELRVYLFLNYLIDNHLSCQTKYLLKKKYNLLSHEQRKQIVNAIYCVDNCKKIDILEDSQYVKVKYYSNSEYNRPLLITFDPVGSHKRIGSFGTKFGIENGYDVLHFALAGKTQYQYLSREQFKEVAQQVISNYKRTICYGSSLGGYAALYYSDIFNSDVIAFSPYDPYNPMIIDHFKRKIKSDRPRIEYKHDIRLDPVTTGSVLMSLDREIPGDYFFYKTLLANKFHNASIAYVDYSGHPITTMLVRTEQLKHVILTAIEQKRWSIDFIAIRNNSYYYYNIFLKYRHKDRILALKMLKEAISREDGSYKDKYLNALRNFIKE